VIVGAGFIGLEAAAALRVRGVDVTVVAPESVPLAHAVGAIVGEHLREVHEAHGVDFRLGRTVTTIDERGVVLSDGARVDADVVLVAVGVRPEVGIAAGAGLKVDRGVVVDAQLRTSAPGIWAAGDVARWPDARTGLDLRIEHWAVAQRQGATAARNMLGADEAFTAVPFFWSVQHEVTLNHVGVSTGADHVAIDGDVRAGDAALAWRRGPRTLAVLTIGRDRTSLLAEAALERDDQAALAELVAGTRAVPIESH
jgi:3-phenylpropionate/trans-cinnamate dioxygenase ferredoxin reductase subunit